MRYALIIAGGSGTRLWPMSRAAQPKQLIPFVGGKSLLQLAFERLEGLVPAERRYICAGRHHAEAIHAALPGFSPEQFLGEPTGRDTLNAIGLAAAVIGGRDPEAIIGVFTADHIIEPAGEFRTIIERGFSLAERHPNTLVTFGITPTAAATCYGYLQLGAPIDESARLVGQFREKPDAATAEAYLAAGPQCYLWNSGMFVWRAATLLDCISRYEPATFEALARIGRSWPTPQRDTRGSLVASSDPQHLVAAIGCDDLIIIHTPDATLVCRKDQAEAIKELHRHLGERYGKEFL